MKLSEFIPLYPLRASKIAWLFGAGSSVSAGLPTANDLVWDFKRRIYCAEQGYELRHFENLSDSGIRNQIQSYFDGKGDFPLIYSPDEYSFYFNKAFTTAKSRREYLDSLLSGVKLSYGHKVIGTLMKLGYIPLIFTTNFDKAFENAAIENFKNSEDWFSVDLDNADTGLSLFQSSKFPLIVKLHGDYFSEKLKNTSDELQQQDAKLRHIITTSSLLKGIAVMGYSGRDHSIMQALMDCLNQVNPFPHGIFWFIRTGTKPLPEVDAFLKEAEKKGIETHLIEIETFDAAWGEFIKGFDSIPTEYRNELNKNYYRFDNRPLSDKGKRLPLLRFNSIEVLKYPATARIYNCDIGGMREVKLKIKENKSDIVVIRKKQGVIGFGSDDEFKRVFEGGESALDVFDIHEKAFLYDDSSIKKMLAESLAKAIARHAGLNYSYRRRTHLLLVNYKELSSTKYDNLKNVMGSIFGSIPNSDLKWIGGLELSLQYKLNRLHLVMTPTIIATKAKTKSEGKLIAPFIKEEMANWYNQKFDKILESWLDIIFNGEQSLKISLYDTNKVGVNANFEIKRQPNFTRFI